ncbi:UNVERIFIED_CONTAM: hypothetical protein HDU68_010225 [Siphonaria sp. JEL0065]|nr:hypothetical protein HDU68_010225 [Siphonaria sp. JEL0065]
MAPHLQLFEVVGRGLCARPDNTIVIEAGWDTDAYVEAAVILQVTNKLKGVRIQAEFRGYCETRWETNIKLATRLESASYPVTHSGRVFVQLVEIVYDSAEPIMPNVAGAPLSLPFSFKLPKNGLPPSFESVGGSISYYIKCSMLYQEGLKLLKSSVDFEVPITILMPNSSIATLLKAPSNFLHQVASGSATVEYSVQIPKRVLSIGDKLEVDIAISTTPRDARLRTINASLRPVAAYKNKSAGAHAVFPRPLAEVSETFPLVQVTSSDPVVRRFCLEIDPEIALASFEGPLISVKTIFRLQVTLDDSETPAVSYEVPIVCVPLPHGIRDPRLSLQKLRPGRSLEHFQPPNYPQQQQQEQQQYTNPPILQRHRSHDAVRQQMTSPVNSYYNSANPQAPKIGPRSDSFNALRSHHTISAPHSSGAPIPSVVRSKSTSKIGYYNPATVPAPPPLPTYSTVISSPPPLASTGENSTFEGLLGELEAMQADVARESFISVAESDSYFGPLTNQEQNQAIQLDESSIISATPSTSWSAVEVSQWLKTIGATESVATVFLKEQVDGAVLKTLTDDDLRNELKVVHLGIRRKILMAIDRLKG